MKLNKTLCLCLGGEEEESSTCTGGGRIYRFAYPAQPVPEGNFQKVNITGTAYFRRKYMTLTEKTVDFPPRAARRIQFNIEGDFPRPFLNEITSPPL